MLQAIFFFLMFFLFRKRPNYRKLGTDQTDVDHNKVDLPKCFEYTLYTYILEVFLTEHALYIGLATNIANNSCVSISKTKLFGGNR